MTIHLAKFPPYPIRDVEGEFLKKTACGRYAFVAVDFEPLPDVGSGFKLSIASDVRYETPTDNTLDYRANRDFIEGVDIGIRNALAIKLSGVVSVEVVLRRMIITYGNTNRFAFEAAGGKAVRVALERVVGESQVDWVPGY